MLGAICFVLTKCSFTKSRSARDSWYTHRLYVERYLLWLSYKQRGEAIPGCGINAGTVKQLLMAASINEE